MCRYSNASFPPNVLHLESMGFLAKTRPRRAGRGCVRVGGYRGFGVAVRRALHVNGVARENRPKGCFGMSAMTVDNHRREGLLW